MAQSSDDNTECAEHAEVERLVKELASEIGAAEMPDEIHMLAVKLQTLIDEPSTRTEPHLP
ncbi:hypothetical protein [Rhizobium sp. C4]|uniref:hypothetical protein n=1 Tax=Rhizobium sp. C4 TaxID=1349800 RepID=UPI001E2ABE4B|nr:hypothetical protein [Rhizobium sp. C4]MCD2173560.1 hypothetical protein [Rhizobium sp. C4]